MGQLNDPGLVAHEYASVARLEGRRLDRTGWLRPVDEPIATFLQAIREVRPRRVLDAGCGTGHIASLLAVPEIVCIDQSRSAVEETRARGLDALQGDIQALPFEDASFDLVTSNWTLYHLPDLDAGLAEIVRVLRPGGRFVGIYNRSGHLDELWSAVGHKWSSETFDGENGGAALDCHFATVERRDTEGEVLWEDREALAAYLDAYSEMAGPLRAPDQPYPFRASRRNCVFVAERARNAKRLGASSTISG